MPPALEAARVEATLVQPYSVRVVSSAAEIEQLAERVLPLVKGRDSTSQPLFYLATIARQTWKPHILVVERAGEIVGLMYTKERKVAGLPTGLIYADATLDSMIVAAPGLRNEILRAAIEALVVQGDARGIRVMTPPDSCELDVLRGAKTFAGLDVSCTPERNHSLLRLPSTYELFLNSLGSRARRNFRYYRRRSQAAGHTFAGAMSFSEFQAAADELLKQNGVGSDVKGTARALNMFSLAANPLLVGIRAQDGRWLSILGGWYESRRVMVFFQINSDQENSKFSLSVVLRGYLIEALIARGERDLIFWAGAGGCLSRYVASLPTVAVYLDRKTVGWRGFRKLVSVAKRGLPARVAPWCDWVVPSEGRRQENHTSAAD